MLAKAKTSSWWCPTLSPETLIRSFLKMAACAPIRFRASNLTASTAHLKSSIPMPSFGPTAIGKASRFPITSSMNCTSARSRQKAPSPAPSRSFGHLKEPGCHRCRTDARWRISRRAKLGLRSGGSIRAPLGQYGGPDGLKSFVDACHQAGLAVVLDAIYNHVGPGRKLPRRIRALLHRPISNPLGTRHELRWTLQ